MGDVPYYTVYPGITAYQGFLKNLWMKFYVNIEGSVYKDDCRRLERACEIYEIRDPWYMSSEREQQRFQAINELIRKNCGKINSVLEIGSSEGHHTQSLMCLASEIVGIEVSAKAIARAQRRRPTVRFIKCRFPQLPHGLE